MGCDFVHNINQMKSIESCFGTSSEVSLFSLPLEIIQIICQNLIDSEIASRFFGRGLSHLLNLRTTCAYMNNVVLNIPLNLKFQLSSSSIPSQNSGLYSLIEFMASETMWRVSTLILNDSSPNLNSSKQLIGFLGNFGQIFEASLKSVTLNYAQSVCFADELLSFLNKFAFTNRTVVTIRYSLGTTDSESSDIQPYRDYVRDVIIARRAQSSICIPSLIQTFANVRVLTLTCPLILSLTVLSSLKYLQCLTFKISVIIDEISSYGVSLESVQKLEMDLHAFRRKDVPNLSMDFIPKHFPNLRYFRLSSCIPTTFNFEVENSVAICLPDSCESLHVHSQNVLSYFGKAKIRNLSLLSADVDNELLSTKDCLVSLSRLVIDTVYCNDVFEVLGLIFELLKIRVQLKCIAFDVSEFSARKQRFISTDDFERIRGWFNERTLFFEAHENFQYLLIGKLLLTFKTNTVSSKEWMIMKHFDAFHDWSRKLLPKNVQIIDVSA